MKTLRKRISSHLKNGSPTKPIRYKLVCEQNVFCYCVVRSYLGLIIQNRFILLLIRNSLSDVLSAPLFVAAVSFFVAGVEFQVGVLAPEVFRYEIFSFEDL